MLSVALNFLIWTCRTHQLVAPNGNLGRRGICYSRSTWAETSGAPECSPERADKRSFRGKKHHKRRVSGYFSFFFPATRVVHLSFLECIEVQSFFFNIYFPKAVPFRTFLFIRWFCQEWETKQRLYSQFFFFRCTMFVPPGLCGKSKFSKYTYVYEEYSNTSRMMC